MLYIMTFPGILLLLFFNYIPMAGLIVAFKNYNVKDGIFGSPWKGFDNFRYFFSDPELAMRFTINTLRLNFYFMLVSLLLSVMAAIFLNEIRKKLIKKLMQSIIFFPYFLSWVVVSAIVYSFLADAGVVNSFIKYMGGETIRWYLNPQYWRIILTICNSWKWVGFGSILYLSAITGFDTSWYEAAIIDGASKMQQIFNITIPLLKPTIIIVLLMQVGRFFFGDFGMIYSIVRNNSMLLSTTDVIDTYVFRSMIGGNEYSMTTAVSLYQSFAGLILILLSNTLAKKITKNISLF